MKHNIVGYGSLISHNSLKDTIPNKKFTPVIVKGYKRIFNFKLKKSDLLNLKKDSRLKFNGILFTVNNKELKELIRRESNYQVRKTTAYDFETGNRLGKCLIFIDFMDIDKFRRKPNKKYFVLCREAAYHISKNFGKYWDKTTHISTGEKVSEWIKKNKAYDTIKK